MKCRSVILFLFLPLLCCTQNYRTVIPSAEEWFADSTNITMYHAVKPDSVTVSGNDTTIWHFRIVRQNYNNWTFDTAAPSWIGYKTIFMQNGDELFFNSNNDTIRFQPRDPINSTWTLYTFPNGDHYRAKVTSVYWYNGALFSDSVRNISLDLLNSSNQVVSGYYSGACFKVSRHNGMLSCPDIYNFPNGPLFLLRADVHRLTKGEVFSYQTGDMFQVTMNTYNFYVQDFSIRTITNRIDWSTDSVRFDYFDDGYILVAHPIQQTIDTSYFGTNTQETIYQLDSLFFPGYPEQQMRLPNGNMSYYLMLPYHVYPCLPLSETYNCIGYSFDTTCQCYPMPFEAIDHLYTYINGAGYVQADENVPANQMWSQNLDYLKHNGDSCGVRRYLGVENADETPLLQFFPNPSYNTCRIVCENYRIDHIEVVDIFGKVISDERMTGPENEVDLNTSSFAPGIYFIRVYTGQNSVTLKLIRGQH